MLFRVYSIIEINWRNELCHEKDVTVLCFRFGDSSLRITLYSDVSMRVFLCGCRSRSRMALLTARS